MLYPVLTESRGLMDLSGIWAFKLDNGKGFDEKWYEGPMNDTIPMAVPSSYNDLQEGEDFREHYGWVFYQRAISVPAYRRTQRIVLRMAAVTQSDVPGGDGILEFPWKAFYVYRVRGGYRKRAA